MTIKAKLKILIKNLLTNYKLSFLLLYPLIFVLCLIRLITFLNFKKKNINLEFKDNLNEKNLDIESGKTHINFKKNSTKITLVLRIAEINNEIKVACKKYDINFDKLNYDLVTNIQSHQATNKTTSSSLYYWIFKLLFKFPKTSTIIFCSFHGLIIKNIYFKDNNFDGKIANYLGLNFLLKNFSQYNFDKNQEKKIINDYINKFNDHYSLSLVKHFAEFNLSNASTLKEISKIYFSKFENDKLKKNYFLGSSLYAFGHMLAFIDYHYRINSKDIKIVLSPHWIANSCLAYYLKNKYSSCIINHDYFISIAQKQKFGDDTITDLFNHKDSVYNLTYKEYLKTNTVSSSIDDKIINKILNKANYKKISINHKYICFFNRDTSFKKENFTLNANDQDRVCDVDIFLPVIDFFLKKNLKIVVMGNPGQQKIKSKDPNIIDYANSKYKNDFNDILLSQNCEFFLNGGSSSNEFIPPLFRKFSLNLERPFNRKPKFHDLAYYTIRPMYKKEKLMNFEDYFNDELFSSEDFNILKKLDYKLEHTSSKDLLSAAENFWEAFNGRKNSFIKKKIEKGNINNYYNLL